jgi:serine/threonine protein kinase
MNKWSGNDLMNYGDVNIEKRIVIGDEDTEHLKDVSSKLRSAGYSVVTTPSSDRLVRIVKKTSPDIVVLSDKLKGLDGFETCTKLVEKLGFPNPVMMISSESSENSIVKAYEVGVSEYLVRPCPDGLLRAKIKLLLQNAVRTPFENDGVDEDKNHPGIDSELDLPVYRIVDKIGSGSMGNVYRAIHKLTFETVAIKVIRSSNVRSIRDIQRFFRGSLIGLELPRHDNLVQIIEIKKMKDIIYQVMEYVDGKTLQDIIKKQHRLSQQQAVFILKDICLALDVLHQNQVIHRDVKPGNIFVTDDWVCKLGDLGISRRLIDRTATTTGHIVGTPGYISPEQILDIRPLDIRADIYSLGLTLYHAISGANPFNRETPYDSMLARLEGPEVSLDDQNARQINNKFRSVINCMVKRRAQDRYPTPLAILSDLEQNNLFDAISRKSLANQPPESQTDS